MSTESHPFRLPSGFPHLILVLAAFFVHTIAGDLLRSNQSEPIIKAADPAPLADFFQSPATNTVGSGAKFASPSKIAPNALLVDWGSDYAYLDSQTWTCVEAHTHRAVSLVDTNNGRVVVIEITEFPADPDPPQNNSLDREPAGTDRQPGFFGKKI